MDWQQFILQIDKLYYIKRQKLAIKKVYLQQTIHIFMIIHCK